MIADSVKVISFLNWYTCCCSSKNTFARLDCVGVDLHKRTHTAVVINCWNEKLGEIQFENKPSVFEELTVYVNKCLKSYEKNCGLNGMTPIYGLEDTGGYGRALAVYLVEHKQIVKEVNPALPYLERKSYPTTQKSDSWDAEAVAKIVLQKLDTLPDANPQDIYWTISQLVGRRNTLMKSHAIIKNQLHSQLSYHYPSYNKFFCDLDGKCALAFWHKYPAPYMLDDVSAKELALFLRQVSHNTCSTRKAEQILQSIAADGETKRNYQEQRNFLIQSHVRDLRFKKREIKKVENELQQIMQQLDYKLESMPGIDLVNASSIIAEIGDVHRFSSPETRKICRSRT